MLPPPLPPDELLSTPLVGKMTYVAGVLVEAGLDELLEVPGEVARQLRRIVLRDQEQNPGTKKGYLI